VPFLKKINGDMWSIRRESIFIGEHEGKRQLGKT
jgi:hypothetical protein